MHLNRGIAYAALFLGTTSCLSARFYDEPSSTDSEIEAFRTWSYSTKFIDASSEASAIEQKVFASTMKKPLVGLKVGLDVGHGCVQRKNSSTGVVLSRSCNDPGALYWEKLNSKKEPIPLLTPVEWESEVKPGRESSYDKVGESDYIREFNENFAQAYVTAKILAELGAEVTVFPWTSLSAADSGQPESINPATGNTLNLPDGRDKTLQNRGTVASGRCGTENNEPCAIFISIHKNSVLGCPGVGSSEQYIHPADLASSRALAKQVQSDLVANLWGGLESSHFPVEPRNLAIYRALNPGVKAALLTESFYLCGPVDLSKFPADDYGVKRTLRAYFRWHSERAGASLAMSISKWTKANLAATLRSAASSSGYASVDGGPLN